MARLSREQKREQKQAAHAANPAAVPIDVHVPVAGAGAGGASVGGAPVAAGPGEEIQQAVLDRLHRLAHASGRSVLATVHDERIGYVVPLRVDPDGSSHFTAQPVRTGQEQPRQGQTRGTAPGPLPAQGRGPAQGPVSVRGSGSAPEPAPGRRPGPAPVARGWGAAQGPVSLEAGAPAGGGDPGPVPASDSPTHRLRSVPRPQAAPEPEPASQAETDGEAEAGRETGAGAEPAPVRDDAPTSPLRSVPGERTPGDVVPTFEPQAVSESAQGTPPGTVAPPTGEFGPPPSMDATRHSAPGAGHPGEPGPAAGHLRHAAAGRIPSPGPPAGRRRPEPSFAPTVPDTDPDPRPTPPRGFDAVAEAVLGDASPTAPGDAAAPALLAEPTARIHEAVRAGRIDAAARLAGQTVTEASDTLGPQHPEVLRLRELTAYIAYLAGEPLHAFRISLDLAGICRRAGDAEAAYGNVRSAATAWRAVRDPLLGLELGHELIGLWTGLTAEEGPAADEIEELESARARMGRLTARAQQG